MLTAVGPRVPPVGPVDSPIFLLGEGPGPVEARTRIPFSGPSGDELTDILTHYRLYRARLRISNLIKNYIPTEDGSIGKPTQDDIEAATPEVEAEIRAQRPRFILAVGAYSTRWLLGDVDLDAVHGLPQRSDRCPDVVVIPTHHPAYGLRDPDAKALVWWDFEQAAKIIRGELPSDPIVDELAGHEFYDEGAYDVFAYEWPVIAIDTEGPIENPDDAWGFSVTVEPGIGYVFRRSQPYFEESVRYFNDYLLGVNPLVVYHNGLGLDIAALRGMGVRNHTRRIWDTMVAQFFLRVEPQALKVAARRRCGMVMRDYNDVIGDAMFEKHIAYLSEVACRNWGKPEAEAVYENDGTTRLYRPQPLHTRAAKILEDLVTNGKDDTDLGARWKKIGAKLRNQATEELGPWPVATLDDVPLEEAIWYSGRDPDATLRLFRAQQPLLAQANLTDRLELDLDLVDVFEEMQSTGFHADRAYWEKLSSDMWDQMMSIGSRISHRYNNDKPFNPASHPQVAALAKSRNLKGAKKTPTGAVSTSKKSMEHLRTIDDAMDDVFTWREHQKVKDSFAEPILAIIGDNTSAQICCTIKNTRVESDRISAADPNLTAIPVQNDLAPRVRGGFRAPSGMLLGSADLSQIEMRWIAHLSNDPLMCQLFWEKRDIHAETAIQIFHLDPTRYWDDAIGEFKYPSVHKMEHRNPTKRAGFGVGTGIQGPGLLDQLRQMGCEGWRVQKFPDGTTDCVSDWCPGGVIHGWFGVFPRVRQFFANCGAKAEANHGWIREFGGFPKLLPGVFSRDEYIRAEAVRNTHSHVIQGSAQWQLRKAMQWIKPQIAQLREDSGLYLRWVLQIHDEIIFAFHPDLQEAVREIVLDGLINHSYKLRVPVNASWSVGETWDKLK